MPYSASASRKNILSGIGFMVLAMFCFAVMNVGVQALSKTMPSETMVFWRNIGSLIVVCSWIALRYDMSAIKTPHIRQHIWRSAIGLVGMEMWFYSITIMPVTFATAITFTAPIFATLMAIVFLGERAGMRRWTAISIGFIGMLIILRPDTRGMDENVLIVLVASVLMAVTGIMVKHLSKSEAPETIVFYMALVMTPLSFPLALAQWQVPNLQEFYLLIPVAVSSTCAHLFIARAFKRCDIVALMPFDFLRLVFTALLAYILFGEILDIYSYIGAAVIVASTVYIAHREAQANRQKKTTITPPSQG